MYHIFGAFYVCACVIWAVLPGLWIRSRSFTERALTTPPTWRRNPGGKAVNVKKGYSWNTQNGHTEITRVTHWHSSKCHEDRWTSVLELSHRTKDFTAQKFKPVGHAITSSKCSNHNTRVMQRYRDSDTVGDRLFYWVTTLLSAIHQDVPVDVSGLTSGNKMLLKAKRGSFTYNSPFWYIACISNISQICMKSRLKALTKLLPVHVYFSTI